MYRTAAILCIHFLIVGSIFAQIKVACIGNSITSGYSNTGYSYVPELQTLLGNGYIVQNYGVSGTTLLKKGDSPYWNTSNFKQALALQADIITIKLGTNDTKTYNWDYHQADFRKNYLALIDTLIATNVKKPVIYPVFPVPIFTNSVSTSWGMRDSIIINCEIPIIKEIAAERGLTCIDAYTPLLLFGKYFTVDGVHPDKAAADSIAHMIYRAITGATHLLKANSTISYSKHGTRSVYSAFNGNDVVNIFANLIPGYKYEFSLFTLNGALVNKTPFYITSESQSHVRDLLENICGPVFLVVNKQ